MCFLKTRHTQTTKTKQVLLLHISIYLLRVFYIPFVLLLLFNKKRLGFFPCYLQINGKSLIHLNFKLALNTISHTTIVWLLLTPQENSFKILFL